MIPKRKLCVITGSRAEYGLLKHLIKEIDLSDDFELILFVTGSHLEKKFGHTIDEIVDDGFKVDLSLNLDINDDSATSTAKSTSHSILGFSEAFNKFLPDLIIILGDRYELLGAAISAMYHHIPIAHLHGGEVTEGAMDESIRHSLSKFSHIHFVANEDYKKRVMQLGENPDLIFNVGGLGVDAIKRIKLISRAKIEEKLKIKFKKKNLLVTFHPVTLAKLSSAKQMNTLLKVLSSKDDSQIIFTMPNADPGNKDIYNLIEEFSKNNKNACFFNSLGQELYFSCIAQVDAVIGNSSSGLGEVPSFRKATVNIGNRQTGRLKATSVIDCLPEIKSINDAIDKVYTPSFQKIVSNTKNPYGDGGSAKLIMKHLRNISFHNLLKKRFYDYKISINKNKP